MNESQYNSFLAAQPVGALMRKFSLPCILSLLVGALYNIVDQLFIANASYLGSYGNAANSVVDVLRFALARPNIALRAGEAVTAVRRQERGFVIETESETIPADRVIIACGGAAGVKAGGVRDGYTLLQSLGHRRTALHPALVQLTTDPTYPRALRACAQTRAWRSRAAGTNSRAARV